MFDTGIWSVFKAEGPSACRLHVGTPTSSLSSVLCSLSTKEGFVTGHNGVQSRAIIEWIISPKHATHPDLKNAPVFGGQRAKTRGGICGGRVCQEISGELWRRVVALPSDGSVVFSRLQLISCFSLSWQRCVVVFVFFALPQGCETARVPRQKKRKVFGRKELWMFFVCLYTKLHFVLLMNGRMSGPVFSQDTSGFLASIWTCFAIAFILLYSPTFTHVLHHLFVNFETQNCFKVVWKLSSTTAH